MISTKPRSSIEKFTPLSPSYPIPSRPRSPWFFTLKIKPQLLLLDPLLRQKHLIMISILPIELFGLLGPEPVAIAPFSLLIQPCIVHRVEEKMRKVDLVDVRFSGDELLAFDDVVESFLERGYFDRVA